MHRREEKRMIKAKYLGMDMGRLESGKVYRISTRCTGNRLLVSSLGNKKEYSSLESFLKEWKIVTVCSDRRR